MDVTDLHPPDDYSHHFFIWHEWIQANGPLTPDNVLEYFSTSMFWDKQSNNQVLRMQTMHSGVPLVNESEELKRFTGVEFALVHSQQPSLFIIQKRERLSPEEVRPMAAYFVINNRIYQSPDVYTILSNRLLTSLHSLQASLDILRNHRPEYTPRTGFAWPITDPSLADNASKKRTAEEDANSTAVSGDNTSDLPTQREKVSSVSSSPDGPRRQQNSMLLFHAMRTTAAHSKLSIPTAFSTNLDSAQSELGGSAAPGRSSMTPAPAASQVGTPKPSQGAPTPQEPVKGAPGQGKKKKKRMSIVAPS